MDLSIIILSYKSKEHLRVLLPSLYSSEGLDFNQTEVIVVDNGSSDGTYEWLEEQVKSFKLKVIKNANTGFASGNNIGIEQSSGKYVLLLNPDTKLEKDTLKTMLDFMEASPNVGISGCKLVKADGKLDLACRRRFPNPLISFKRLVLRDNKDYNYSNVSEDESMEVDSVVGAFLLIRKSVIDKIGLLDEKFFMYGEDLDWCFRAKEAGFKIWYYPKTICHHYKGESSKKVPFRALKWFHDAMWIFYNKHYTKKYFFVFNWLVFCGIYIRFIILVVYNFFKASPRVSK